MGENENVIPNMFVNESFLNVISNPSSNGNIKMENDMEDGTNAAIKVEMIESPDASQDGNSNVHVPCLGHRDGFIHLTDTHSHEFEREQVACRDSKSKHSHSHCKRKHMSPKKLDMDNESVIAAIFKRPAIWDKRHKQHSNRIVVDKYWKEVAAEVQNEEITIRKKWKYLRDKFAVECGKEMKSRSGDAADSCPPSKWMFYQQLVFLKDIVTPRVSSGSLKSLALGLSNCTDTETDQPEPETSTASVESAFAPPSAHKRKRKTMDYQNKLLELEERKIQYLLNKPRRGTDEEDSDLMFYKALLCHVRLIPQEKKLQFQGEIQAVVQKYAYTSGPSEERMPYYQSYGGSSSPSPSTSREFEYATARQQMDDMY